MKRKPKALTDTPAPRPTLILSPSAWRDRLCQELIYAGLGHDTADLVARRTLKGLVDGYLTGRRDEETPEADYYAS